MNKKEKSKENDDILIHFCRSFLLLLFLHRSHVRHKKKKNCKNIEKQMAK